MRSMEMVSETINGLEYAILTDDAGVTFAVLRDWLVAEVERAGVVDDDGMFAWLKYRRWRPASVAEAAKGYEITSVETVEAGGSGGSS